MDHCHVVCVLGCIRVLFAFGAFEEAIGGSELMGINFQNVASNDAVVSARLTQLLAEGWKIAHVTGGVESNGGQDDGQGIFLTRYILVK